MGLEMRGGWDIAVPAKPLAGKRKTSCRSITVSAAYLLSMYLFQVLVEGTDFSQLSRHQNRVQYNSRQIEVLLGSAMPIGLVGSDQ